LCLGGSVEYELTAVGASLVKPLEALSEWALTKQISPAISQPGFEQVGD